MIQLFAKLLHMQYYMHMKPNQAQDEQFISRLKANGERTTSPRLALFRTLRQYSPLPMSKLSKIAKTNGIDPVTVYRSVALFKRLKLVQEIGVGNRRLLELTDDFGGHHHHFWCTGCGKILDFDDESLERAMDSAAATMGITIESHQLEITGRCVQCQLTNPSSSSH